MSESRTAVVDVHAHALFPAVEAIVAGQPGHLLQRERDAAWFGAAAAEVNQGQLGRIGPLLTDVGMRLAAMDEARVDVQIVAPMPLYHAWADKALATEIVGATNQALVSMVSSHADRLVGIGTVSLQHPELATQQLERWVGEGGLRGVQIGTTAGPRELDDPELADFWARAEQLNALVFIHPWGCSLGERLNAHYLANTVGNPVETTVALSRLVFSGLLDRHPSLRICSVHGGGYLPTYLGRSDHAWHVRPDARTCERPPSSYLPQLWFDSLVYTPAGLRHLVEAVGADRVLLGSDYPFDMGVQDPVDRLEAAGLSDNDVAAIAGGNAARLLAAGSAPPH